MKKLYLFLFTVLCFAFASNAQRDYTFHLTVDDPTGITVKACDYYDDDKVLESFEMTKGVNTFEFTSPLSGSNLIISCTADKVLKVHNEDGSVNYNAANNTLKLYLSPWDSFYADPAEQSYTLKTFDAESFRNHSVKVTLDNPEGIRMTLRGNNVINTDQTEYELAFNDIYEDMLTIRKADTDELIYKITANGEEVEKNGLQYEIPLVDRSDEDDIKYITDVVITQDFPENLNYTVKFVFTNGDPGCVNSVTYGDVPVEDFANENGFVVRPGKKLYVEFNTDEYRLISYQKNDNDPYESSYISIVSETIGSDFTLTVTAEKYKELTAILVIEDPETVKVSRGSYSDEVVYDIVAGENVVKFSDKAWANDIKVEPIDGYELTRIYDAINDKEIGISTWSNYTTIYLEDQARYEISTTKIYRDKNFVVYVDDLSSFYYPVTITRGGRVIETVEGYNTIDFREKDGLISFSASYAPDGSKYYRNYELMNITYLSYFSVTDPQDNDVIKLFFNPENAVEHSVKFDMNEDALEGYEVKKDILTPVFTEFPVPAIGKTLFTIAPVSRAADDDLTITVGEKAIEPVDGVYSFETEADTTVKVTRATSGLENVISGENGTADVYNLQGIRVARQANAVDVNALPAGIYIVNGQKVAVK